MVEELRELPQVQRVWPQSGAALVPSNTEDSEQIEKSGLPDGLSENQAAAQGGPMIDEGLEDHEAAQAGLLVRDVDPDDILLSTEKLNRFWASL